jgi:hypothetical protein
MTLIHFKLKMSDSRREYYQEYHELNDDPIDNTVPFGLTPESAAQSEAQLSARMNSLTSPDYE